ncbi:hypothetical protein [Dyella sp. RRB7]|uniref:hypothetical protein n=1 Tax=Dyella sp. RRB7 TaxID=2919502 RepID=UPI001FAA4016|nr:hypothetical protein [Dyella sp. RRB7]
MRYRHLPIVLLLLCASAAAQGVAPPAVPPGDRWTLVQPAPAATSGGAYRDALSTAANDAQRFNFSGQPPKDNAPPDQTPIRVIINNGHGPHVNCVPMGVSGACH